MFDSIGGVRKAVLFLYMSLLCGNNCNELINCWVGRFIKLHM